MNCRTPLVSNSFSNTPISTFAYAYDELSRRTQRLDTTDSALTTNTFSYNVRSELIDATMGTNTYSYAYDPIGNRTSSTENGVTNVYASNELNQYTSLNPGTTNSTPFTYDADGNMTQYGDLAFFWDAETRLLGGASNGIALVTNRYDFMGRRTEKASAAGTNSFIYDGWNLVREDIAAAPVAVAIANADFADGLDGWTYSNVTADACGPQTVANFSSAGAWLEQDVGAVAGDEYVVSFRYHPFACGLAPGYGAYPWSVTASIGDATASTNGSYAPWATWQGMSNFTFRLRPSVPGPLRIAVGGMPNPVVTHVSVSRLARTSKHYCWGLDLSGTLQGAGGIGGLLVQRHSDSASPCFSFCDANGNITDLLDGDGIPVARYEYDSYGNTTVQSGTQALANPFRFSSKFCDDKIGLCYYGYRFYSPKAGRWISRDPWDDVRETGLPEISDNHSYDFVENDSISEVDVLGLYVFRELPSAELPVLDLLREHNGIGITEYGRPPESPLEIKYDNCCCSVAKPKRYERTVQITLPSKGSRGASGAWVVASTRRAVKRHEKKHVKIWEHYSKILEQFERWQTKQSASGCNEDECRAKLIAHIQECEEKASRYFWTMTDSAHAALDTAEGWHTAPGQVPSRWFPDGHWLMSRTAVVFEANGNWTVSLEQVRLDCDDMKCAE